MKAVTVLSSVILLNIFGVCFNQKVECVPYTRKSNHSISTMLTAPRIEVNLKEQVKFYLFTRRNPSCVQELKLYDEHSIRHSNFVSLLPIRFVIHGWKNDLHSEIIDLLRSAYLFRGDFNVIAVDWGMLAYNLNYNFVARLVDSIGEVVSEFISFLHKTTMIYHNNIYIIGHSLGAHIAGRAGFLSKKVNTIFALDPAEPYFKGLPLDQRIDASDAKYVEVIHTDIGLLGYQEQIGHADFYPNYGQRQPGCELTLKTCSHSRAYHYFVESINSKEGFWAIPCGSIDEILKRKCIPSGSSVLMGGEPANPKVGIFYLPTNKKSLFAKGKFMGF